MNVEKTMEFILEQQAQWAAHMADSARLARAETALAEGDAHLAKVDRHLAEITRHH